MRWGKMPTALSDMLWAFSRWRQLLLSAKQRCTGSKVALGLFYSLTWWQELRPGEDAGRKGLVQARPFSTSQPDGSPSFLELCAVWWGCPIWRTSHLRRVPHVTSRSQRRQLPQEGKTVQHLSWWRNLAPSPAWWAWTFSLGSCGQRCSLD